MIIGSHEEFIGTKVTSVISSTAFFYIKEPQFKDQEVSCFLDSPESSEKKSQAP
jgi:hypothetical protein